MSVHFSQRTTGPIEEANRVTSVYYLNTQGILWKRKEKKNRFRGKYFMKEYKQFIKFIRFVKVNIDIK